MKHSEIKVYPKNWEKPNKTNLTKDWYIYYEFNGKQIRFKGGINYCKTLEEKQSLTKKLIFEEIRNLQNGFNPITKEYESVHVAVQETTPFVSALKIASEKIKIAKSTKEGIIHTLKIIEKASIKTGHAGVSISEIRKRDVRLILDEVLEMGYSNDRYNKIKTNLGILYNYLVDLEIFEHNYIHDIRKLPHTPKPKDIFRDNDIKKLNELKETNYKLWRFLMIFHCSQSRIIELRELKIENVDYRNQTFTVFEKKGKQYHNVLKPINIHTAHLWREVLDEVKEGDIYLFNNNYEPGTKPCTKNSFQNKYDLWVKEKLGITKTPYALRHTYANHIANTYGISEAQKALGHTNQKTTEIYAVDYRHNLVKKQSLIEPVLKVN